LLSGGGVVPLLAGGLWLVAGLAAVGFEAKKQAGDSEATEKNTTRNKQGKQETNNQTSSETSERQRTREESERKTRGKSTK